MRDLTIWVIPQTDSFKKDDYNNYYFTLDSHIVLADTKTGKIISKYYNPQTWTSDAYSLTNISIDTLDFRLNDGKIQFGIHSGYRGSSSVNPGGHSSLELFIQQEDSLVSVFHYDTYDYRGENDGGLNGNGWVEEYTTQLLTTNHKTNGFSDFTLLTEYRFRKSENDVMVQDSIANDSISFYRYSPDRYIKVNQIEGSVCREINGGWGKRECYYFGKTLTEVYQQIYDENKENLQQHMLSLPELPSENIAYEKIDEQSDEENILAVSYYKSSDELNISFCTDFGCRYYIFQEKKGVTIFTYDYHD